ncbi:MAG: WbuC family cupin fold metalloprotein [Victivallales bacterium]|nr:WbuC family cupin fold metalloprotein [Victivallales bacterium]
MQIIDDRLLAELSAQARASERLRKNLNFHRSLEEKCHRFLNALEPGTVIPIHHHPTKDEGVVILKGKVRVLTYNDDGAVQEEAILCREEGRYGVDIPRNVWHAVECLEPAVLYECKEGPFIPHEQEGVLEV